jgi:hypothetical protein
MGTLTAAGYIPDSVTTIKDNLETEAVASVTGYTQLPSGLQENMIQVSAITEVHIQDMVADLLNGIGLDYANDFMIKNLGASFGIFMKDFQYGQVYLLFSDTVGTVIPAGTRVKNTDGSIIVATLVNGTISSTGTITLLAESTTEQLTAATANSMTVMVDVITGVTVTNPLAGTAGLVAETIAAFKLRVYSEIQSARSGNVARASSELNKLSGVNSRLIKFKPQAILSGTNYYQGIECIVGGGDDAQVAGALLSAFLQTQNLVSAPSNGETARTVTKTVNLYNSSFVVKYTRPKQITVGLTVTITFNGYSSSQEVISGILSPVYTAAFSALTVGSTVNMKYLDSLVIETFKDNNIDPEYVQDISYAVTFAGSPVSFTNNYLPIQDDWYLDLTSFAVTLA